MKIVENANKISPTDIMEFYVANGWGKKDDFSEERIKSAFSHSTFSYFALEDNELCGFIRGFSDNVICSWIAEIVVTPEKQNRGVGSLLLSKCIEDYGHTAIYGETFRGKEAFFEKNDIKAREKMIVVSRRGNRG